METKGAILITGGSRGLGAKMVEHVLGRGHRVATFARSRTEAIDALEAAHPGKLLFAELDIADTATVDRFVREAHAFGDGLHALVNNAAIGQDHLLTHLDADTIDRLLGVNLRAPILLAKAVVKRMIVDGRGGRIVNITSICGLRGYAGLTVYGATKGALDAFTRALAREVGARGILVNSIAPGFFASEMSSVLAPEQLETIRRRTATGKLSEPEHVVAMLDLLLFTDSNVTGQVLVVDGGVVA